MTRHPLLQLLLVWIILAGGSIARSETPEADDPALEAILSGIEARYAGPGFSARFDQTAVLKAMDITDTAEGTLMIKRPGKMRWEYTAPEPQLIITDGESLWMYRPEENQVMVGRAPTFFGGGKGAAFLSDIRQIRAHFTVRVMPSPDEEPIRLELIPEEKNPDLARVLLSVERGSFVVQEVTTINAYDDETRIRLHDYRFGQDLADDLFTFRIPEGVDIVEMGQ